MGDKCVLRIKPGQKQPSGERQERGRRRKQGEREVEGKESQRGLVKRNKLGGARKGRGKY